MTDEHKTALAKGRAEGRAVKEYLEALVASKPKRGRRRTPDSIGKRLQAITTESETANPLIRLQLVQERMNLEAELEAMSHTFDMSKLEAAFVGVAASYGDRKGISFAAWREIGVDTAVLRKAGIGRGS